MRKVVAYELLSLDGVAEKPDGFFADWDEAMEANLGAVIAAQDSVILGRRSYDEWAEFWPGSDIEPFATFINGVAKYVATSTPLDRKWANTTVVDGELVEFVRDLRNQPTTGWILGVEAHEFLEQSDHVLGPRFQPPVHFGQIHRQPPRLRLRVMVLENANLVVTEKVGRARECRLEPARLPGVTGLP